MQRSVLGKVGIKNENIIFCRGANGREKSRKRTGNREKRGQKCNPLFYYRIASTVFVYLPEAVHVMYRRFGTHQKTHGLKMNVVVVHYVTGFSNVGHSAQPFVYPSVT